MQTFIFHLVIFTNIVSTLTYANFNIQIIVGNTLLKQFWQVQIKSIGQTQFEVHVLRRQTKLCRSIFLHKVCLSAECATHVLNKRVANEKKGRLSICRGSYVSKYYAF